MSGDRGLVGDRGMSPRPWMSTRDRPSKHHAHGPDTHSSTMRLPTSSVWQSVAMILLLSGAAQASLGDRLPDFKHCLEVHSNHIVTPRHSTDSYSRSVKRPIAAKMQPPYVRGLPRHVLPHSDLASFPPPPPSLGLSRRMRLLVSTHRHRATSRSRPAVHATRIPIPREMAILPLHGHARAL